MGLVPAVAEAVAVARPESTSLVVQRAERQVSRRVTSLFQIKGSTLSSESLSSTAGVYG